MESFFIGHPDPGGRLTLFNLDHAFHHIADEHQWKDTMFKDLFERFGSIKGVNIKQRLSVHKVPTWAQFLEHVG
jgi:hypothetical protein